MELISRGIIVIRKLRLDSRFPPTPVSIMTDNTEASADERIKDSLPSSAIGSRHSQEGGRLS